MVTTNGRPVSHEDRFAHNFDLGVFELIKDNEDGTGVFRRTDYPFGDFTPTIKNSDEVTYSYAEMCLR